MRLANLRRIASIVVFMWGMLQAGITGKVVGTVSDAQSGAPLIGANIVIEGTSLGCASDFSGNYVVLNITPGLYSIKATMIGYKPVVVKEVVVNMNLTSTVNIEMTTEALGLEEVVVVAERPIVKKDISNSQMSIQTATLENVPITTIGDALTLQAGIQMGTSGLVVRGGDANQTVFMVDGFSTNDERSNNPYVAVSISAVEEIQVQTGGFNAEYGQARSGIVNAVTKEGRSDRYTGTFIVKYSLPTAKHFGGSLYSKNSYLNRPFYDDDVCWVGTQNGAWDGYTQNQYYQFEGWNAVSQASLQDSDPTNDLTPSGAQRIYEYYHRRLGDIKKGDYNIDMSFGGPIPFLGTKFGNPRFYFTHFRLRDMFVYPLARDSYQENHTNLKITTDLTPTFKLILNGLYGEVYSVSPYNWTTTPTGRLITTQSEVADLVTSTRQGIMIPYMPGYYSPGAIFRQSYEAKLINTINSYSFMEARFQYKYSRNNVRKIADRDTTKQYEIFDGYYLDEAPYGYSADGTTGPGSTHLGGWMNLGRDSTENSTITIGADYTAQIGIRHQIKTGFEVVANNFKVRSGSYSDVMLSWTRSLKYTVNPYRIGVYLQDQMDYQGFIGNFGLRLDYSDGNTKYYLLDTYSKYYSSELSDKIESEAPYRDSKAAFAISPRLGISYPITNTSKLYFNYGHFRSEPSSIYRFGIQREGTGTVTYMGNPDLTFEKTIAYELGYEQSLLDLFLIKGAAYYKDVTDQAGWVLYTGLSGVQYYKAANNNYADIRGVEFTLTKRAGKWFTGFVNYTYDVRKTGYFGYLEYYEDPQAQRDYLKENPVTTRRNPAPYARMNLDFHTPDDFGPRWRNLFLLGGYNLNILADWQAGAFETYNPQEIPGVVDDVQWKDWSNVTLRISKTVVIKTVMMQTYIDVSNLFNNKYLSSAGFADAQDRLDYLESLNFEWEEGIEHGHDRIGDYRPTNVAYDPLEANPYNDPEIAARNKIRKETKSYINMPNITELTFLNPRSYTFGIRLSF